MKEYLIDGNNLIHKVKNLSLLQGKDPQSAREKLAFRLETYFSSKNVRVFLFFDGFENLPIRTNKIKIIYSETRTADEKIRGKIENAANSKNIVAVSSDDEVKKLAQACAATTLNSEDFAKIIFSSDEEDEEEKRIRDIDNDEFKKLFGVDD